VADSLTATVSSTGRARESGSGGDTELDTDWGGVKPVRAKIWELAKKSSEVGSDTGFSACGRSGVGGTKAIVGGCRSGVKVAGAGIVTGGVWTLGNVKGRALRGGSSRAVEESEAWGIEVTEGGC
jgi:hypothetical protein